VIPAGVVPSVNDVPHCCWTAVESLPPRRPGIDVLITLYAALMQFEHRRLLGSVTLLNPVLARVMILERVSGPVTPSTFVSVCVTQLVSPSFKHTTFLTTG